MGQILGDLNGLRHEMKYIAEPGNVERYVPSLADGAWTDDDTDIEWIYILEMERSGTLLLPPGRMAELWRRHINRRIWCSHLYLRQLLDIGIELGIVKKSGAFHSYADTRLGQGRENAREFLRQNPSMAEQIEREIRQQVAASRQAAAPPPPPADLPPLPDEAPELVEQPAF